MIVRVILVAAAHQILAVGANLDPGIKFAPDSSLEEDGFELVVPLSKRTAVLSSPFDFPVDGIGCERSNLRKQRFRVPGS
jgi:hypothetical protein